MPSRIALAVAALAALVSCAAPQPSLPTPTTPSSSSATPAPSATALPAGARRFEIVAERSLATIRVREQIAAIPAPGDAVLTTRGFSGAAVLLSDGTFANGSEIGRAHV